MSSTKKQSTSLKDQMYADMCSVISKGESSTSDTIIDEAIACVEAEYATSMAKIDELKKRNHYTCGVKTSWFKEMVPHLLETHKEDEHETHELNEVIENIANLEGAIADEEKVLLKLKTKKIGLMAVNTKKRKVMLTTNESSTKKPFFGSSWMSNFGKK